MFKLIASDSKDRDVRIITLPVAANAPPVIESLPQTTGTVGEFYSSRVTASDPNGDTLRYELKGAPQGYEIDEQTGTITWQTPVVGHYTITVTGVIDWSPGLQLAGQTYTVTVFVTDGRDEPVSTSFDLKVLADTLAPSVTISVTP